MKMEASAFVADPELVKALRPHATPLACAADQTLFTQGEPSHGLYIVHSGAVELTMHTPAGEEILRVTAARDSLLGLPALLGNAAYTLSATARRGAEVSLVTKEEFARLMLAQPSLSLMILRVLAAEVRSARVALTAA